jgi:hypothetical protein
VDCFDGEYTVATAVTCTNCGQDWIGRYVVIPTGRVFYMCPECEWIWARLPEQGAGATTDEEDEDLAMEVSSYVWDRIGRVDD